jgi:hypothetical protein
MEFERIMTATFSVTGRFGGILSLPARLMGALQAAVLGAVLLCLPAHANAAPAAPTTSAAAGAHVYLMRGFANIFSLGLDQIAVRLDRQGIPVSVHNYISWAAVADEAAALYRSGRIKTIILVGHSSGATYLPDMVARLDQHGVPVKLAIGLDSIFHTSLTGRVGRYINFYIANGAGTRVEQTSNFRGTLENVDVEQVPGVGHVSIDKNEVIQQKVIAAIDTAVVSGPSPDPMAAPALAPAPSVAKPAPKSKRAAN